MRCRADADAQEIGNARFFKLAHQHCPLAQSRQQITAFVLCMAGKHKIGGRWQYFEASRLQGRRHDFALRHHRIAALFKIGLVGKRGHGGGLGDLAIRYGYYRYQTEVIVFIVALLVLLVIVIQSLGNWIARKLDKR